LFVYPNFIIIYPAQASSRPPLSDDMHDSDATESTYDDDDIDVGSQGTAATDRDVLAFISVQQVGKSITSQ
jgi:hypothetical protein